MRRAILLTSFLAGMTLAVGPVAARFVVSGRIELPGGEPAPSVTVELIAQTNAYDFGRLVLAGSHYPEPVARALTGPDGHYDLEAPEAGMWHLYVAPESFRPMEFYFLPLVGDRIVPTLELSAESAVSIRVVDADGEPLAGSHIRAGRPAQSDRGFGRPDDWRPAYRQAFTDERGRAVLGRGANEGLNLYAFADGHVEAERTGVESGSVVLRLEAANRRRVRVQDVRGQPVANALFRVGARRWPAGISDEDGLIELALPTEGEPRVHVIAEDGGEAEARLDLAAAGPEDVPFLTALPPARRAGRIIDGATGGAIPDAFAWIGGRPADAVRVDPDGSYSLSTSSADPSVWVWGAAEGYIKDVVEFDTAPERSLGATGAGPTLALRRAIRARGVVVDENDRPVPEVAVSASVDFTGRRQQTAFRASSNLGLAVSDPQGRFSLGDLHPEVGYVLRAVKPGFAPAEIELPNPGSDLARELRIVLERGRIAIGTVASQSGDPVAGARIALEKSIRSGSMWRLMAQAPGTEASIEGYTDEAGRFAIEDLPAGVYDLEATASGFAPISIRSVEIASESTEIDLGEITLEPGAVIEGRVTDLRGSAIEGAQVFVAESMIQAAFMRVNRRRQREPAALSDVNGFFAVADRRVGEVVDLTIKTPGFAQGRVLAVEAPTDQPIAVRLSRTSRVRGEVVDTRGRAISGAFVWVSARVSIGPGTSTHSTGQATTADNGRFVIEEIDPGEIEVKVEAEGYRNANLTGLMVEPEQDLENLRIVMEPGAAVSGRVTDASGRPLAHAMIQLSEGGRSYAGFQIGDTSDNDGRYRLEGIAPGRQSVTASHEDFQSTTRQIEVELGENRLDLTLEAGVTIFGRVVDESGEPVAGADVALDSYSPTNWQEQGAVSDTQGAFAIRGVAQGSFTLRATKEGFATGLVEDLEVGTDDLGGIEIRLTPGAAIVGRLLGLEPSEYPIVQVMAFKLPRQTYMGRVDGEGNYRIDDLAPGDYVVRAQVGMSARSAQDTVSVTAAPAETLLDLEFESGLTLTGVVLRGGEPTSGAFVTAIGTDVASSSRGMTNNEGRFDLKGLKPGKHALNVSNFQSGLNHIEEIDLESDREVVIWLESASVSGLVLDASDSRPLDGATLRLESLDPQSPQEGFRMPSTTTADSSGFFRFAEASSGTHRLVAQKEGYAPAEMSLTVIDGLDQEGLELRLEPTEGLTIFVTLPSGQPAGEFFAAVLDASGQSLISGIYNAGAEGTRISIPPGDWELLVSTPDTAVSSTRVSLPSEPIAIALEQHAQLEIRVPELEGDPALTVVRVTRADGSPHRYLQWTWTQTEWQLLEGEGSVPGLPPGTWLVTIQTSDGRVWQAEASLAAGENPPVVLE